MASDISTISGRLAESIKIRGISVNHELFHELKNGRSKRPRYRGK